MEDPRKIIAAAPMSTTQWLIVAVMVGLNALDGFDVLSSALHRPASPRRGGSIAGRSAWSCPWN